MNWTGGSLGRSRNASNSITAIQKKYFAKRRAQLLTQQLLETEASYENQSTKKQTSLHQYENTRPLAKKLGSIGSSKLVKVPATTAGSGQRGRTLVRDNHGGRSDLIAISSQASSSQSSSVPSAHRSHTPEQIPVPPPATDLEGRRLYLLKSTDWVGLQSRPSANQAVHVASQSPFYNKLKRPRDNEQLPQYDSSHPIQKVSKTGYFDRALHGRRGSSSAFTLADISVRIGSNVDRSQRDKRLGPSQASVQSAESDEMLLDHEMPILEDNIEHNPFMRPRLPSHIDVESLTSSMSPSVRVRAHQQRLPVHLGDEGTSDSLVAEGLRLQRELQKYATAGEPPAARDENRRRDSGGHEQTKYHHDDVDEGYDGPDASSSAQSYFEGNNSSVILRSSEQECADDSGDEATEESEEDDGSASTAPRESSNFDEDTEAHLHTNGNEEPTEHLQAGRKTAKEGIPLASDDRHRELTSFHKSYAAENQPKPTGPAMATHPPSPLREQVRDEEAIWRSFIFGSQTNFEDEWTLEEDPNLCPKYDGDDLPAQASQTHESMLAEIDTSPLKQNPHLVSDPTTTTPEIETPERRAAAASVQAQADDEELSSTDLDATDIDEVLANLTSSSAASALLDTNSTGMQLASSSSPRSNEHHATSMHGNISSSPASAPALVAYASNVPEPPSSDEYTFTSPGEPDIARTLQHHRAVRRNAGLRFRKPAPYIGSSVSDNASPVVLGETQRRVSTRNRSASANRGGHVVSEDEIEDD